MTNGYICELNDGRRLRFSLKKRDRDPNYLVVFRGPDGKRKERSTQEPNQKRAVSSAIEVIKRAYQQTSDTPSWEDAISEMVEHMEGQELRRATIDDYRFTVMSLWNLYPNTFGPGAITEEMAERYKLIRLRNGCSPRTVAGNINALCIVYRKWWIKTAKILAENPFANVEQPKFDKKPPRIILPEEGQAFLRWLNERWSGWRLPQLFLEVKGLAGCRITELAAAPTDGLKDSRIRFDEETTKGRKQRSTKLPPNVFDALCKLAGPTYVFEKYSEQLRAIHLDRGCPHHARCVREFSPVRFKRWLQGEKTEYFKKNPEAKPFKLHNFRGTTMTKAKMAGISYDDAAIAFGCHPETMRKHYLSIDELAISDRVMDALHGQSGETNGEKSGEIDDGGSDNEDGKPKSV